MDQAMYLFHLAPSCSDVLAKSWQVGDPMTPQRCRDIMHQLHVQDKDERG